MRFPLERRIIRTWAGLILALALAIGASVAFWLTRFEPTPRIQRELFLSGARRRSFEISPDGKKLAWLQTIDEHTQVWVGAVDGSDGRVVSSESGRGVGSFIWAENSRTILYPHDYAGDENDHLYAVDLDDRETRDLTPWPGVRVAAIANTWRLPDQLLIEANKRDRRLMDVWRIDLRTGTAQLDTQNPGDISGWVPDQNLAVRAAIAITPDGGCELRVRDSSNSPWRVLIKAERQDSISAYDFSDDGDWLLLSTTVGSDTHRAVAYNVKTGARRELASNEAVDLSAMIVDSRTHRFLGAAFDEPAGRRWTALDPSIAPDFTALGRLASGNLDIDSSDHAQTRWIVAIENDRMPRRLYLWSRATRTSTLLYAPDLIDRSELAEVRPIEFRARDGILLHGYLTLPVGLRATSLPTVLLVHGGPGARDRWGYNPLVQLLANRGYAVLQVNFRGSSGFGKRYQHAGDRQWGRAMQDDLTDGVHWAIEQGVADPHRIAIVGGSYGGYAALAGAAFTPNLYRCAVDSDGPSNLLSFMAATPSYWAVGRPATLAEIGNPDDPDDRAMLRRASPLFSADRIKIPLLISQGANDVRVKPSESEAIFDAVAKNNGRAIYLVYPDEGHGFTSSENFVDLTARTEEFLGACLGGRYEPRSGKSSAIVREVGSSAISPAAAGSL